RQGEVRGFLPHARRRRRGRQLPGNEEKAVAKETDACQAERGQDGTENLAAIELRLTEGLPEALAKQDRTHAEEGQVHPGKISRHGEQGKEWDITDETDHHEKESRPEQKVPTPFHRTQIRFSSASMKSTNVRRSSRCVKPACSLRILSRACMAASSALG